MVDNKVSLGKSLLRSAISKASDLPAGCYCKPGQCGAPRPEWCRDAAKRDGADTPPPANKSPDTNVEKNREMLLQRSIVGLAKYGMTTDKNPLELREWLQHALEEALDMANYLQAAITKLDEAKK